MPPLAPASWQTCCAGTKINNVRFCGLERLLSAYPSRTGTAGAARVQRAGDVVDICVIQTGQQIGHRLRRSRVLRAKGAPFIPAGRHGAHSAGPLERVLKMSNFSVQWKIIIECPTQVTWS